MIFGIPGYFVDRAIVREQSMIDNRGAEK